MTGGLSLPTRMTELSPSTGDTNACDVVGFLAHSRYSSFEANSGTEVLRVQGASTGSAAIADRFRRTKNMVRSYFL